MMKRRSALAALAVVTLSHHLAAQAVERPAQAVDKPEGVEEYRRGVSVNLPFTQTPLEAAEAVKAIRPKVVYPYHYRDQDTRTLAEALKDEKSVEVRLRNWY